MSGDEQVVVPPGHDCELPGAVHTCSFVPIHSSGSENTANKGKLESNTTKLNRDSVLGDFLIQAAGWLEVSMDGQAIFG